MKIIIELPGVTGPGVQVETGASADAEDGPGGPVPSDAGRGAGDPSEGSLDAGPAPLHLEGGDGGAPEGETASRPGGPPAIDAGAGPSAEGLGSTAAGSVPESLAARLEGPDPIG